MRGHQYIQNEKHQTFQKHQTIQVPKELGVVLRLKMTYIQFGKTRGFLMSF